MLALMLYGVRFGSTMLSRAKRETPRKSCTLSAKTLDASAIKHLA